ncbi:MAG: hypothetical protein LBR44_10960 [Clostridiales Family XIII bacterium]|jgi:hypothetical protein|nr:hypothetical protein [Clostridiales Family XIII bacterium]
MLTILRGDLPDFTPHHFDMTMKMTDRLGGGQFPGEGLYEALGDFPLAIEVVFFGGGRR